MKKTRRQYLYSNGAQSNVEYFLLIRENVRQKIERWSLTGKSQTKNSDKK